MTAVRGATMNASRLRELVDLVLAREGQFKVQEHLVTLNTALANLAGSPQDTNYQTVYAQAFDVLQTAVRSLSQSFTPTEVRSEERRVGKECRL